MMWGFSHIFGHTQITSQKFVQFSPTEVGILGHKGIGFWDKEVFFCLSGGRALVFFMLVSFLNQTSKTTKGSRSVEGFLLGEGVKMLFR